MKMQGQGSRPTHCQIQGIGDGLLMDYPVTAVYDANILYLAPLIFSPADTPSPKGR